MKMLLLVVGILAVLSGVVWIGQGTGTFPYPASSFMVKQTQWAWYGAALSIAGLIAIWVSRRS